MIWYASGINIRGCGFRLNGPPLLQLYANFWQCSLLQRNFQLCNSRHVLLLGVVKLCIVQAGAISIVCFQMGTRLASIICSKGVSCIQGLLLYWSAQLGCSKVPITMWVSTAVEECLLSRVPLYSNWNWTAKSHLHSPTKNGTDYSLPVSYTHLTLPTIYSV